MNKFDLERLVSDYFKKEKKSINRFLEIHSEESIDRSIKNFLDAVIPRRDYSFRKKDSSSLDVIYSLPQQLKLHPFNTSKKKFFLGFIPLFYGYLADKIKNIYTSEDYEQKGREQVSETLFLHVVESLKVLPAFSDDDSLKKRMQKDYGVKGIAVLDSYSSKIINYFFDKTIPHFLEEILKEKDVERLDTLAHRQFLKYSGFLSKNVRASYRTRLEMEKNNSMGRRKDILGIVISYFGK